MSANSRAFESAKIIASYVDQAALQKPEEVFLERYKERLSVVKMLDIGVGAGRTTLHFAPRVHEYIGIDLSEGMISKCREKFKDKWPHASFHIMDATKLSFFPDETFDFVFFSYNGIDYLSSSDRQKCLFEIQRVLKKGGLLFFSAHNLNFLSSLFPLSWYSWKYPLFSIRKLLRKIYLRILNHGLNCKARSHVIVKEEHQGFILETYYIAPQAQVEQLVASGFRVSTILGSLNGEAMDPQRTQKDSENGWLYYLAERYE